MLISTKGRYALRVMIPIPHQNKESGHVAMKIVAPVKIFL